MQDIMADSFEDGAGTSLHHLPAKPVPTVPLMDDPNDDFCRVCGYGVRLSIDIPTFSTHASPALGLKAALCCVMLVTQWITIQNMVF